MNPNRENTFNLSTCSNSSKFTTGNTTNLIPRLKMPTISWEKTTQQVVTSNKINVQEHDKEVGNKLVTLHGTLRQEADKIKQWKLETETELKRKEKQIAESTQTIENLRKYILELQVQNENISLKMQEEVSCREETLKKVESTRELCNVLKEHVQYLQNQSIHCEATCNELKSQEREHFENFKDLSLKFQNLNISATEEKNQLKSELAKYSSEKEELGKYLEKSARDAEKQNMIYTENLLQKESEIEAFAEKINMYEKQKTEQEEMILHLSSNMQDLKHGIEKKETEVEQLIKEVGSLTKEKFQLSKEYEETRICLSEIEEKYKSEKNEMSEKIDKSACELGTLQEELKDVKEKYEKLKEMHETLSSQEANSIKLIEDLKSDKDILILEKANLDTSLKNETHSKNELQTTVEKKNDQIKHLNRCIIELNDNLDVVKKEHSKTLSAFEENKKLFNDLQEESTQITREKKLLQNKLDTKSIEYINLEEKLKFLEKKDLKIQQSNKDLGEIKQQNDQLTKNLSDLKIKLKSNEEKYKNHVDELEKCKQDTNVVIDKYKSDQEQLQCQIKEFKENIHQLEDELTRQKKENETLLVDKQTFEDMAKQKETAEKEIKQAMNNCEIQRQEMISTLLKYKQENEKIIDLKEKEIQTIRTKSELQNTNLEEKFHNDVEKKTKEWEEEKKKLKDKISEFSKEFALLKRENKELKIQVEKAATNSEMSQQLSNNNHNKTPVFLSRRTPQRTFLATPQLSQYTPLIKSKSKISRKRKVVFNPENASFISDTDSSVSEYGPLYIDDINPKNISPKVASNGRIRPKAKNNALKDVQENLFPSENQLNIQKATEEKDFTINALSKEVCDEIQPKKTKSGRKLNLRKSTNLKSEISKPPTKLNKNKNNRKAEEEPSFWFDNDPIFGFVMDN